MFSTLRDMRSHCGECVRFGIANLARVLLFCLLCFLVLGLVLLFFLLFMVVVCSSIGGGFLLVCDVMSFIRCLVTCNLEGLSPAFIHLSCRIDCGHLSRFCVT